MNTIATPTSAPLLQHQRPSNATSLGADRVTKAGEVRDAFTQFVGQTFFGQMMKAMRSMTDKPAYFHGGRGEEVFRSQLDQHLADEMTQASADRFARPMFEQQFPHLALILREHEDGSNQLNLEA